MKTICFTNNKGGVGKSTSAASVASCMAINYDLKVLVIDLDPQGNVSSNFIDKTTIKKTAYDMLKNRTITDEIIDTNIDNIKIIPANLNLDSANMELTNAYARESILKKCLKQVENEFDVCVIDTAPTLSVLTFNGLVASDGVYIPVRAGGYEIDGMTNLIKVIKEIQESPDNKTKLSGIFFTHYMANQNMAKASKEEIEERFMKVMDTQIRNNVQLAEATYGGQTIFEYEPKSNGAIDYKALTEEIMKIENISTKKGGRK